MAEESQTMELRSRTGTGINWVGAFLLYAKGATLQEVSDQLEIQFSKLKNRAREEDWDGLVKMNRELALKAPSAEVSPQSAVVLADAENRIKANRESGLSVAQGLREHIKKILEAYKEGNLFLPPNDIKILAQAAATLDSTSMTLLGDDPAPKFQPPPNPPPGAEQPVVDRRPITHFHINMPGAAMAPRIPKKVHAEKTVTVEVKATQADPIIGAQPRGTIEPVAVPDASVPTGLGRSSVDFDKVAAAGKREEAKPAATGVPEFFR